jgi:hypothetical protein
MKIATLNRGAWWRGMSYAAIRIGGNPDTVLRYYVKLDEQAITDEVMGQLAGRLATSRNKFATCWADGRIHACENENPSQVFTCEGFILLPGQDSNLDKENQNLLCYRYTTG